MTFRVLMFLTCVLTGCSPSLKLLRLDGSFVKSSELTNQIQILMDSAAVTGLSVVILNNNEIAYQKAFGYANLVKEDSLDLNHVFYAASFSKAVFGYLVAQLASEKVIDLDRPIQKYLDTPIPEIPFDREWKGYQDLKADLRYEQITARMCLSHTTGLPNWRWLTKEADFDRNGKLHFFFDPGTRYSYSGEGIKLLQFVIEEITGQGLEDLARQRIFEPLGMKMTSYLWQDRFEDHFCYGHHSDQNVVPKDKEDEANAAGSMETTIVDYAKFVSAMLRSYNDHSPITQLLFEQQVRITSKHQFGAKAWVDVEDNDDIELSYGLGWGLLNSPHGPGMFKEGHGDGFQHYSIIFPNKEIGVILMSNSDNAESIFKALLEITIRDVYTPWQWERYVPFDLK